MKYTVPVRRFRVGVFVVDLRAGEVRNGRGTVVLPEQPFQILRMLIAAAGEIVTREEIQKQLWPNDTVVEFDHSINAAVNKLRQALGDSAGAPKYIETIARRGYRLLVAVEPIAVLANRAVNDSDSDTKPVPVELAVTPKLAPGTSLIGKKVSHYRVLNVIGGGGMGLVYEAEDLKLGRRVALKFLPEELACDPAALQRFEREARAASSLDHPNICTIYEVEEHETQPFIVMQLLRGETLRDRLAGLNATQQRFSVAELTDLATQICDGLSAAHAQGIIHRDIKPANIFLTNTGQAKILDFGLAKLIEAEERHEEAMAATASGSASSTTSHDLTATGLTMGTAGYMSPEQVRGEKLDGRTDLFSLGLVLYEMATGHRAFSGETAAVVKDAIQHQRPVPAREQNPDVTSALERIIDRAIEKEREQRYQRAEDIRLDLLAPAGRGEKLEIGHSTWRSRWKWLGVAALVCTLLGIAGFWYWSSHRRPKLTEQDTIVIADFENKTGDPVFDDTLKQGLAIQLGQSPFINILPDRRVRDTLKLMKRPTSEPLTESVGREVCLRSSSKAMLTGSIANSDGGYVINVTAIDCNLGNTIAQVSERARDKNAVLRSLDNAAFAMRQDLGESLNSVQTYATPLDQATTPSLEALKAYSLARKTAVLESSGASIPVYERAVELDPSFATAYRALAQMYRNVNQSNRAQESSRKAYVLRDKVSEREKLAIEGDYYDLVTGELYKAQQTYEAWHQNYPGDDTPVVMLGIVYSELGSLEKYLELTLAAMRQDPHHPVSYENLEDAYKDLNRLDEAEEVLNEGQQSFPGAGFVPIRRYDLAFVKGNSEQMAQLAAVIKGLPGMDDSLLGTMAGTEAWHGRIKKARSLGRQAIDISSRAGSGAIYLAVEALTQAPIVPLEETRADALAAVKASNTSDIRAQAALALAIAGDGASAQKLASQLDHDYPLSTQVQDYWLPTIRAAVALQTKHPNEALALLKKTSGLELSQACLCSAYIRGQAYLMLGNGADAAAEFQKYIDHYGLVGSFTWGAIGRVQLARAYALEAQTDPAARDKALTAYQNFLTLWKDADSDIPIYKQAKAEYKKLLATRV